MNKLFFIFIINFSTPVYSFYYDFGLSMGLSEGDTSTGEKSKIAQYGVNGFLGYRFFRWLSLGNTFDYRLINQYSDVDSTVGNLSAKYLSYLTPTMITQFSSFQFRYEHKLEGEYQFNEQSSSGEDLLWIDPQGYKVELVYLYPVSWGNLLFGIFIDQMNYSTRKTGSSGEQVFSPEANISQYGISLRVNFEDPFSFSFD